MLRINAMLLVLLGLAHVRAQDPLHRRFTKQDGLPSNTVYCGVQDDRGFMWFGTDQGLSRFDGTRFRNFSVSEGLPDNNVIQLAKDSRGRIWVMTLNGRLCYVRGDTIHGEREHPDLALCRSASGWHSFAEDTRGRLWFGGVYNDLAVLSPDLKRDTAYAFPGAKVSVLTFGQDSMLVVTADSMRIYEGRRCTKAWSNTSHLHQPFVRPGSDRSHGALLLHPDGIHTIREDGTDLLVPQKLIYALHTLAWRDGEGTIWLRRAMGGIERWQQRGAAGGWEHDHVFVGSIINDVVEDDEGGRWFLTTQEGLLYSGPTHYPWSWLPLDKAGLGAGGMLRLMRSSNGDIYIGCANGELLIQGPSGRSRIDLPEAGRVLDIAEDASGMIWLATDHALYRLDPRTGGVKEVGADLLVYSSKRRTGRLMAKSVVVDPGGRIWTSSFGLHQVMERTDGWWRTPVHPTANPQRSLCLCAHRSGLLVYEVNDQVYLWNGGDPVLAAGLSGRLGLRVTAIDGLPDGRLVFGTTGAGVVLADSTGAWSEAFTATEGLLSNDVRNLRVQGDTILVATTEGVQAMLPRRSLSGWAVVEMQGAPREEINDVLLVDGQVLVATSGGLAQVPWPVERVDDRPVRIHLTGVWLNDALQPAGASLLVQEGRDRLRLAVQAIEFDAPHRVTYQYRLGPSAPWRAVSTGEIELASLTAGDLAVEVRARRRGGPWSTPVVVRATVKAPWHRRGTTWAGAALGLALVAFGAARYHARQRYRLELLALRQREALDLERRRIAADVHDDLGADLSRMRMHAMLMEQGRLPRTGSPLSEGLSSAIGKIDEIIWSLDPRRDTLQATAAFIEKQATELLGMHGITYRAAIDLPPAPVPLKAEDRRAVLLIVREALRNAVTHARCTEVLVAWAWKDGQAECRVADDGAGLKEPAAGGGRNGLENMRERAVLLHGTIHWEAGEKGGTTVVLRWPVRSESPDRMRARSSGSHNFPA